MTRQPRRIGVTGLSRRQLEVLRLLAEPYASRSTVARDLGVSVKTIDAHLCVVYRTLGVSSALQAYRVLVEGDR